MRIPKRAYPRENKVPCEKIRSRAGTRGGPLRCRMMEGVLHRLLNMRSDFPIWVRYVLALGLVAIAFFARLLMDEHLGAHPFLLFIPAILLASVLFDRGSGLLATLVAAALAARYLLAGPASSAAFPLVLFVITGLSIAAVTELLRTTLRNLAESKRFSEVLLQELAHRTRNDLATIVSILRLQARSETNPAVQAAMASAVARVDVVAKVHDRLRDTADSSRIELAPYIQSLCSSLADFQPRRSIDLDRRPLRGDPGAKFAGRFHRTHCQRAGDKLL